MMHPQALKARTKQEAQDAIARANKQAEELKEDARSELVNQSW